MGSLSYHEGRNMEKNISLHEYLNNIFGFSFMDSDGSSKTKTDIYGIKDDVKTFFSVKNPKGKNTQVHLTSLNKFCSDTNTPLEVQNKLEVWLGTNDNDLFNSWSQNLQLTNYEKNHNRLLSSNISNWTIVENWFNTINRSGVLPKLLIESLKNGEKSKYIVWVNKKTNIVKLIEVEKLINFIIKDCEWITMPRKTVLKCLTPQGKPILSLQMKGNREEHGGYNHSPQFHIIENWPTDFVIKEFKLNDR